MHSYWPYEYESRVSQDTSPAVDIVALWVAAGRPEHLLSMDPNRYEVSEPELLRGLNPSGRGGFLQDGP